jgi:hypothetical protein
MQEDATVNETGATRMLSKTIDVDGLKVFCREGGAPGRGLRHRDQLRRGTLETGYEHVFSDFRSSPK